MSFNFKWSFLTLVWMDTCNSLRYEVPVELCFATSLCNDLFKLHERISVNFISLQ